MAAGHNGQPNNLGVWDINTGSNVAYLIGHTNNVNAVQLLTNGDLASGSTDCTIKVWNSSTYALKYTLNTGIGNDVNCLKLLPSGYLASGNNNIMIWNMDTRSLVTSLIGHTMKVRALELLTNGDLASASDDSKVKVWDIASYTFKYDLIGHSSSVNALKLLSNGLLASGSSDCTLKVWNTTANATVGDYTFALNGHILSLELLGMEIY